MVTGKVILKHSSVLINYFETHKSYEESISD
jgi:hypothetical protein